MHLSRKARILCPGEVLTNRKCLLALACVLLVTTPVKGSAQSVQVLPGVANAVHSEVLNGSATLIAPLPPSQILNFGILLQPRNQTALTSLIHNLGDPSSAQFRKFLTPEQFLQQYGPSDDDYQAVLAFAKANGLTVTKTYKSHLLIDLSGTVSQVETAFSVKMNTYQHPTEARTFYSPDREPTTLLPFAVQSIAGLDNFATAVPAVRKLPTGAATPAVGSGPSGYYLPSDIRAAYYGGTALTGSSQIVGLLQFENFNISDITSDLGNGATSTTLGTGLYRINYSTQGTAFTPTVYTELIDGASSTPSTSDPNGVAESALDVAQAIGMAPGVSEVIEYIGANASNDYDLFAQMANENSAKQIGVSWTWNVSNLSRLNGIFSQMQTQGQNIFAATGDYGSWPYSGGQYFPAEDPSVTAVGGTNLGTNGAGGSYSYETGWSGSSGGYSQDQEAIPSYQSSLGGINGASSSYRNAPDVSMEASSDYACSFGSCGGYVGTSFATPRWAGFLALANQQASQAGNTSIGFINPILYSVGSSGNYGTDFHDITSGSNGSFSAGTNYDLVTGLGSPNGQAMINILESGSAPRPWNASVSQPKNTQCSQSGSFSLSTDQQNTVNSLNWTVSAYASGFFENNIYWSLQDSAGTFLSGNIGSGSQTGSSTGTAQASRAPSGTPTLYVNGSLIGQYSGCYDSFSASSTATH